MVHHSKCPLCSAEQINLYIQTNDFFLSFEPFSLYRCHSCGFVFTQDHPDEVNIGRYYTSEEYFSHNTSTGGWSGILYRFARKLMLQRKRTLIKRITGLYSGSILDLGSGTGHFLSEMKDSGWAALGIEINEKARLFATDKLGVDTLPPEGIYGLTDNSFDCITMWHVLEHFQDPGKYLDESMRLLKPSGSLIIALPNGSSYDASHYRKFWAAFDVPRHLWHFTPETFSLFSGKAGFVVKKIKSLPLDVFYISILSEKYKGTRLAFPVGIVKGLWFSLISLLKTRRSSSLIFILKRV